MNADNTPAVPLDKPASAARQEQPVRDVEVAPAREPQEVRASDADRDRIADILREALAEGRLEAEEHAERVEAAYRAKTLGKLEPLIRDLPAGQQQRASAARGPAQRPAALAQPAPAGSVGKNVVAVLSGASRQGRWRVGARVNAVAVCGGVELDLTEAIFEQQYVVINAVAVCGGIEIRVPENVTLRSSGTGVMGGFEVREAESAQPDAPVVMVEGVAFWGGVEAKPVVGKRVEDLRDG